jgi:hypothetical protein
MVTPSCSKLLAFLLFIQTVTTSAHHPAAQLVHAAQRQPSHQPLITLLYSSSTLGSASPATNMGALLQAAGAAQ